MAPKKRQVAQPAPSVVHAAPPVWPTIARAGGTTIETLLPDQIVLLHELFDAEACKRWRTFMSSLPFEPPRPPKRDEAARTNARLSFVDAAFAERLWTVSGLKDALRNVPGFEGATGLNANLRLYRYDPETYFGRHYDESTKCPATGRPTRWTLLIYLSGVEDGVQGGETAFYTQASRKSPEITIVAPLTRGTALLHRHGADCLPHEGRPVISGIKLVLRSDVTF